MRYGYGVDVGGTTIKLAYFEESGKKLEKWEIPTNIENDGTIPSLPVIIQLIKICGLPVERYFNPEIMREESAQRQRVSHKLKLCPEEFLPIIEGAIDGAIQIQQKNDETEGA